MRPIPKKLREELSNDPFYKKCCITGLGDVEWHHNLIYAGRQVNEKFCILPLNKEVHKNIVKYKTRCDWIMWSRATPKEIEIYSKAYGYKQMMGRISALKNNYGEYRENDPKSYIAIS